MGQRGELQSKMGSNSWIWPETAFDLHDAWYWPGGSIFSNSFLFFLKKVPYCLDSDFWEGWWGDEGIKVKLLIQAVEWNMKSKDITFQIPNLL